MQGYNSWKRSEKHYRKPDNWRYDPRKQSTRGKQYFDASEDFPEDDSYDYSEHFVGNSAPARLEALVSASAPKVSSAVAAQQAQDAAEWADLLDSDGADVAGYALDRSVQRHGPPLVLDLLSLARTLRRRSKARCRSGRPGGKNEDGDQRMKLYLVDSLENMGFCRAALDAFEVGTLQHLCTAVESTEFSLDAAAAAGNHDSIGDDASGWALQELPSQHPLADSSPLLSLTYDMWDVVARFLGIRDILSLCNTCSFLRELLESTNALRLLWGHYRAHLDLRHSRIGNEVIVFTRRDKFATTPGLPTRPYRWSWFYSLRRVALLAALDSRMVSPPAISMTEAYVREWIHSLSTRARQCDAAAWLQVFDRASSPLVRDFARIQVNQAVGMANTALALAERFPFDEVAAREAAFFGIPNDDEAVSNFLSCIRLESFDVNFEDEFDAAEARSLTCVMASRAGAKHVTWKPNQRRPRFRSSALGRRMYSRQWRNNTRPATRRENALMRQIINSDGPYINTTRVSFGLANQDSSEGRKMAHASFHYKSARHIVYTL